MKVVTEKGIYEPPPPSPPPRNSRPQHDLIINIHVEEQHPPTDYNPSTMKSF